MKFTLFRPLFFIVLLLVILTVALTYSFCRNEGAPPSGTAHQAYLASRPLPDSAAVTVGEQPSKEQVFLKEKKMGPARVLSGSEKLLKRISRSMVSVITPLGKATGFLIDWKGHILTTGYVIAPTGSELENARNQKVLLEQIIALEQKRLQSIRQQMRLLAPGYEKEQLKRLSDEKKEQLYESLTRKREVEHLLESAAVQSREGLAEIRVFSGEGKQLKLKRIALSSTRNLALLQVETAALNYRPLRPRTIPLQVGDRVYAAGYTEQSSLSVQKGTVLSYQLIDEHERICSDLQIRKEDSGGPLLDSYGNASAILLNNDKGQECGVPISVAYTAFSAFLTPQIRAIKHKRIVRDVIH